MLRHLRGHAKRNGGEIAGVFDGQAFVMRDGVRQKLGVPPGFARSEGRAVNGKGQVAGLSVTATGTTQGFVWDLGTMRGLAPWPGDVSSEARALNIDGDVVGRSGNGDLSTARAMLWRGGLAVDLHVAVTIVGTGRHNGETRAFLLQP